ncbi:MAG: DMT family transporter [Rhodospirillaceae bacterium]|nr:DMT family transporter [Rhodospirillaceae bacterium]
MDAAARPAPTGRGADSLAYALLMVGPFLFATNMLAAKATADLIPPVALAFFRWLGALLLLAPAVWPRFWRQRACLLREWPDLMVFGALGMGVCGAFVYIGADTTSATNIGLIYSSSPVLILVLAAVFYGQHIGRIAALGVALAFAGVLTILAQGDPDTLFDVRFVAGDLWMVAAASGWAIYSILLKHRPTGFDTLPRFFAICLAGVLILLPFTVAEHLGGEPVTWTWETAGWMVLVAAVPGVGAYAAYAFIVERLGPGKAGLILYMIPLIGVVMAWLLLGEAPAWYHYAGAALVLTGIRLANRKLPDDNGNGTENA